jgi:hypothetical protein
MLYVVPREGVENWKDRTGVSSILPPPGTKLEQCWNDKTVMEFIETPLGDALQFVSDIHGVDFFDTSHIPAELMQPQSRRYMVVTIRISGVSLEDGLGAMLDTVDLQARLDGEKIVIELQPDHPAAQVR